MGVTVGLLHAGVHYPDELAEYGAIYHYLKTKRPGARDAAEIAATKAASTNQIPVFVITRPRPSSAIRNVRLAWVAFMGFTDLFDWSTYRGVIPTHVLCAHASWGRKKRVSSVPWTFFSYDQMRRASY